MPASYKRPRHTRFGQPPIVPPGVDPASFTGPRPYPRRARRANPSNLRKTTAVGAYKRAAKKAFGTRRRPFVETKSRATDIVHYLNASKAGAPGAPQYPSDYPETTALARLTYDDAFTMMPIYSFTRNMKGLAEDQMIGDTLFSRFIKLKVQFVFSQQANAIVTPTNLFLVHGWIKRPTALTDNDSVWSSGDAPATIGTFTMEDMIHFVSYYLRNHFNAKVDKLDFKPHDTNNLIVLGHRSVRPNRDASIGVPTGTNAGVNQTMGSLPDLNMSCNWTVNRKVNYTHGKDSLVGCYGGGNDCGADDIHNFPNDNWIPFACVYNPDWKTTANSAGHLASAKTNGDYTYPDVGIGIRCNDCHWYTDS